MKKILTTLLIILCLSSSLLLAGCGQQSVANICFQEKSTANIYNQAQEEEILLTNLLSKDPSEAKKYTQTVITANQSWLYGRYIKTLSFYIYSTVDREVEFDITFTGMQNGLSTLSSTTKDYIKKQLPCFLKANKGVKITLEINDTVYLNTTNSKLTIKPSDTYTEFKDNDFSYSIYGLELIAYHK